MKKLTHPAGTNRSSKTRYDIMCQVLHRRCESGIFCSLYRHKSNADKWKLRNVKLGIWVGYRLILYLTLTQKPNANLGMLIYHGTDRLDYTMQCWLIKSPCHTRDIIRTSSHCKPDLALHVRGNIARIISHYSPAFCRDVAWTK